MIRTRDLVLFVVILLFLGLAISVTVVVDTWGSFGERGELSVVTDVPLADLSAEAPAASEFDRQSVISRLREKLANDTSVIAPEPDTFVGAEEITKEEALALEEQVAASTVTVNKCLYPDDVIGSLAKWPLSGVTVAVASGARVVTHTETITPPASIDATATTSAATETLVRTLLRLPLAPTKLAAASCVPSDVVGVTTSGFILFNSNASVWYGAGPDTLIGYARDGFPIYGNYTGPVDACGGYDHPTGYRYTVSTDRPFIVDCFSATPQSFMLE